MSEDEGVMSSQETDHVSPTEVTPESAKGALRTWRPSPSVYAAGLIKPALTQLTAREGEAVRKPSEAGVYTNQRLNFSEPWQGARRTGQDLEPAPGNLAVRDFRGRRETYAMVRL